MDVSCFVIIYLKMMTFQAVVGAAAAVRRRRRHRRTAARAMIRLGLAFLEDEVNIEP